MHTHNRDREKSSEVEFMNVQFVEVSGHNLGSSQTGGFRTQCLHCYQFQTTFAQERRGVKSISNLAEVTVNSKEENICPNDVQEFGSGQATQLNI
jgi:hypothetical protein